MHKDEKILRRRVKDCVAIVFNEYGNKDKKEIVDQFTKMMYSIYELSYTMPSEQLIMSYLASVKDVFEKEQFKLDLSDILTNKQEK